MHLRPYRTLLSLVVAAGVLGGAATTAGAAGMSWQGGGQRADAQVTAQQAVAPVPSGRLPSRGLPMPGQGEDTAGQEVEDPQEGVEDAGQAGETATTFTLPASVTAPVFGAATIPGSLATPRAGVQLVAEQNLGGVWTEVGTATTDSAGAFRIATSGGDGRVGTFTVRVRSTDPAVSAAADPAVLVSRRFSDPHQRLTGAQVRTVFLNHGIGTYSSGNCTDRSRSTCTSLEQMRVATVLETIILQERSGCPIVVTGGTEVGHASGTYSHYNGYKIDLRMSPCLTSWVLANGRSIGGSKWTVATTVYYNEQNHWDVQTRP